VRALYHLAGRTFKAQAGRGLAEAQDSKSVKLAADERVVRLEAGTARRVNRRSDAWRFEPQNLPRLRGRPAGLLGQPFYGW
jgi:hypothetical protein